MIGDPMEPVTGEAPQPGETPREEGNPWPFSDAEAGFWRGDSDREPGNDVVVRHRQETSGPAARSATLTPPTVTDEGRYTGAAAGALAAGRQDTIDKFAATGRKSSRVSTPAEAVEREHDQVDQARFNPIAAYADPPVTPGDVPDVMVLPEPNRNRPTVVLAPGPVPDRLPSGHSRPSAPRPPSPLLESSPFWLTEEQRAERALARPPKKVAAKPALSHRLRPPRGPAAGLAGLLALGLIAAFFAWVSAEPFWLAFGHGRSGLATVEQCTGGGVTQRCRGQFQAADGRPAATSVTLLGVAPGQRSPGTIAPARMVSGTSQQAYVGDAGWLIQLRWVLGFLLVVLSGLGIAALTGARRLGNARARRGALIMSLTGPLLLLAGFLYVSY